MTEGNSRPDRPGNGYAQSLDYLYGLQKFGMIFGLTQVRKILEAIGNPQEEIPAIHIGGTNGKGSTAAMIASVLQKEGYRVGLYSSPHLNRFTERIKVNGQEIEDREVAALTAWIKKTVEALRLSGPFTFFDFTTAMALAVFSQKRVDLAVLEVGLGGRLDSTNVINPLLSVITNVARDHEEILGKSLLKIAREKAGIIKLGRPLITAATQPGIIQLFSKLCLEQKAPFFRVRQAGQGGQAGKDFRYQPAGKRSFHYEGLRRKLWSVDPGLDGAHQFVNAAVALGALEVLEDMGYPVSTEAMIEGLGEVKWPGRLEMVSSHPGILLDGAHNPAAATILREALGKEFSFNRLTLVMGIMKDKDVRSILKTLAPLANHLILSRPRTERACAPAEMLAMLRCQGGRWSKKAEVVEELPQAIERGLAVTGKRDLLCITGSLYTVGEARAYLFPEGRRSRVDRGR